MENCFCKICGSPVDVGFAERNDGLCECCSAKYDECVLDLSIQRMFGLPDWPFFFECKQIGWAFHIDSEIVREDVIEIEE